MNKKTGIDPHAKREASKYDNPIPSREYISELLESASGPMTNRDLWKVLSLGGEDQREALRRRLIAMERDGQLISNRKGAYGLIDKMDLIRGRVMGHRDGYGFVIPEDGSEDIYLTSRQMRKAFDGDEVLVRPEPLDHRGKRDGAIIDVLVHNTHQLVGRYINERGNHFVRPDNARIANDIIIPSEHTQHAKHGQFVVVDILQQPSRQHRPLGKVVEILGDNMAPGMEIDVAIRSHGIPHEWPGAVDAQVATLTAEVDEEDKADRVDLRTLPFVTIDGEDARDFDDAVYCATKPSGGWRLYVAIADVSHYVEPQSPLDSEAIVRGNSVYFPESVVPMLPEILSNGLCSLKPRVDRLAMVCEMTVTQDGKLSGYKFYEAVIHSHERFTYTQVGQILSEKEDKDSEIRQQFSDRLQDLEHLHDIYHALRKTRDERGAIDFETTETRIVFDDNRKIEKIVPVHRNDAHKLIEECMLAANVCTAKILSTLDIPTLYRVHESPKLEKIAMLHEFLGGLGLSMPGEDITPMHYRRVLEQVAGRPDAHLIQTVLLRSMNQAVYQPENEGHFGLAYDAYAHFTSPIRRYPDLLVHRALKAIIRSTIKTSRVKRVDTIKTQKISTLYHYSEGDMVSFGEQCSLTERRADDATREVVSRLKCEYLQERVGDVFVGVISAVTSFGLFVELKDLYVEGLVHITALPQDYYHFEAAQHRLVGERRRMVFRLGDEMVVQVARVNLEERKVDFELADTTIGAKKKSSRTSKKRSGTSKKSLPKTKGVASSRSPKKAPASAKDAADVVINSTRKVRKRKPAINAASDNAENSQGKERASNKPSSPSAKKAKPAKKKTALKKTPKKAKKSKAEDVSKTTPKSKMKTKAKSKSKSKVKPRSKAKPKSSATKKLSPRKNQ